MQRLVETAEKLLPLIQNEVESPLMGILADAAFWLAVIVMLFSFARLIKEDDGASKNLFWWCGRLMVLLALFGSGPYLLNASLKIGQSITWIETIREPLQKEEEAFNTSYTEFTKGMFTVKPLNTSDPEAVMGVLYDSPVDLRNVTGALDISSWKLPNIFAALTVARGVFEFSHIFLLLLSAFVMMGLRLVSPFMIAIAIDRNLAQRISYPFVWSAAIFTLLTPLVTHILSIIVFAAGNLAFSAVDLNNPIYTTNPETGNIIINQYAQGQAVYTSLIGVVVMGIGALVMFASPYLSYKLAFGQLFEAVSTTVSGWMGAITAAGIEFAGLRVGTALQRQAEMTQAQGAYGAESVRTEGHYEATKLQIQARQTSATASAMDGATQARAAIMGNQTAAVGAAQANLHNTLGLLNASTQRETTQSNVGLKKEVRGLETSKVRELNTNDAGAAKEQIDTAARGVDLVGSVGGVIGGTSGGAAGLYTNLSVRPEAIEQNRQTNQNNITASYGANILNSKTATRDNIQALNQYRDDATLVTRQSTEENIAAIKAGSQINLGGVNQALKQQLGGINQGAKLEGGANQIYFDSGMKAAAMMRDSNFKAADLRALSTLVTTMSRDIGRRMESALSLRY